MWSSLFEEEQARIAAVQRSQDEKARRQRPAPARHARAQLAEVKKKEKEKEKEKEKDKAAASSSSARPTTTAGGDGGAEREDDDEWAKLCREEKTRIAEYAARAKPGACAGVYAAAPSSTAAVPDKPPTKKR